MNVPKIATRTTDSKKIKESFRQKPYHWVFMLILLLAAIPAAIFTCGVLLPIKFALKSKGLLGKWLFGGLF
jgi:hypothetical protein